jgi:hypothetical protein
MSYTIKMRTVGYRADVSIDSLASCEIAKKKAMLGALLVLLSSAIPLTFSNAIPVSP